MLHGNQYHAHSVKSDILHQYFMVAERCKHMNDETPRNRKINKKMQQKNAAITEKGNKYNINKYNINTNINKKMGTTASRKHCKLEVLQTTRGRRLKSYGTR